MKVTPLPLVGALMIEPATFTDDRGWFIESFNQRQFDELVGAPTRFVQDNHSSSVKNVLRGLHYQIAQPQGKLIRVVAGEIFDVLLDIRRSSSTFGRCVTGTLSARDKRQVWAPPGFAHGFLVMSDHAEVVYKTTDFWAPEHERCIAWNDPDLGIEWPLSGEPVLSAKDKRAVNLSAAELFQ